MKTLILLISILSANIALSQYYTDVQINYIDSTGTAYEGDLYLDTANDKYYLGLSHGKLGKLLSYDSESGSTSNICEMLKPNITDAVYKMEVSTTKDIIINGYNFSANSTVSIPGANINYFNIESNTQITINITASSIPDTTDIVVTNTCGTDTIYDGLKILVSQWQDLRTGGATFTSGTGAGNDIRFRAGMTLNRNANGMYFTGTNPWRSWVKFESAKYTRGNNTTVEWVFRANGAFMLGIAPLTNNEANNNQYQEAAVLAYFNSSTNFWGLFGSNTTGTTWNQSGGSAITNGAIYKVKIENEGANGEKITIFQLPSANQADWADESNVIKTVVSTNNNTATTLVPFIIPRSSTNNYFVALRVL